MAKKTKIPEHENHERWMVSYADLLTLLFALFVILYGFAMSAQTEVKSIVQGLVQSFSEMGFVTARPGSSVLSGNMGVDGTSSNANLSNVPPKDIPIVNAPVEGGGGVLDFGALSNTKSNSSSQKESDTDENSTSGHGRDDELRNDSEIESDTSSESITGAPLDSIMQEMSANLQELLDEKIISITRTESWLTIDFNSSLLFPHGSATVLNRFKPILDELASILNGVNNYIHIRGYTDNTYVGDELYKSSWELSAARSISVLNYFVSQKMDPRRLAVEAYGEFSPFASNTTKKGREKNRKVVIAISKYALNTKSLPIIADDSTQNKVNQNNTESEKKKENPSNEINPEDYDIMRLPDGRVQLIKRN